MGIETILAVASTAFGAFNAISGMSGNKAPQVSTTAAGDVTKSASDAASRKAALLETQGGSSGETLTAGQTGGRQTLFGN